MNNIKIKAFAAVLAAVMTAAAFAGCAAGEGKENGVKKASADASSAASGEHAGEKKVEVYLDDQNNPYYYDSEGNKMLLFAMNYDDQMAEDDMGDLKESFIYNNYDNNGLSFTIPEGWFAEDTYGGTPTLYKDSEDIDAIDYNNSISIVPANFMLSYDMDKDKKVDKKYVKNYFDSFVKNGFYESYEITATGEGALGSEKADMYDITVTYKNDEEGAPDLPVEKSRTIIYVTRNKNAYIAAIKVPLDDDKTAEEYMNAFKSFADSIKLPSEEQTKQFLAQFEHDPQEVILDDEGADLEGDDFEVNIDGGTENEDVDLPE